MTYEISAISEAEFVEIHQNQYIQPCAVDTSSYRGSQIATHPSTSSPRAPRRFDQMPDEIISNILEHLLTTDLPFLDPPPPGADSSASTHVDCRPHRVHHKSLNPLSPYYKAHGVKGGLKALLETFASLSQPLPPTFFNRARIYPEVLQTSKSIGRVGSEILCQANTIVFSHADALRCFVKSYPEATKLVRKIGMVADLVFHPVSWNNPELRVISYPHVFQLDLSPFRKLKKVTLRFHSSHGLPGNQHSAVGELKGVDIAYWLSKTSWKVEEAEIQGLDYIRRSDTLLLGELEDILRNIPKNSLANIEATTPIARNKELREQLADAT